MVMSSSAASRSFHSALSLLLFWSAGASNGAIRLVEMEPVLALERGRVRVLFSSDLHLCVCVLSRDILIVKVSTLYQH